MVAGLFAACGLLTSVSSHAIINDDPYFGLYPAEDKPNGYPAGDSASQAIVCGSSGCADDLNMLVNVITIKAAGSGNRDTFLRIAQTEPPGTGGGPNSTTESAYNTDYDSESDRQVVGSPPGSTYINQAKDFSAGNKDDFNNAVLIGGLETINIDGVDYFGIVLDINEPGADPKNFLRLDEFEIYLSADGFVRDYDPGTGLAGSAGDGAFNDNGLATDGLVFDMDFWDPAANIDGDGSTQGGNLDPISDCGGVACGGLILDNNSGTNGSGDEDYEFLIPVALFEAAALAANVDLNTTYMHVVSTFGMTGDQDQITDTIAYAEANFEEYAAITKVNVNVPAPATILLLGLGLLGLGRSRRAPAA
jgi:PEP-CTERM motif